MLRWSTVNGLRINAEKTKAVFFRSRGTEINPYESLTLDGIPVVQKNNIVGVAFSGHMKWSCHVESFTKSLSRAAAVLLRYRHFLLEKAKVQIYHALFFLHINYCLLVWGTTTLGNIKIIHCRKEHCTVLPMSHTVCL